MRAVITGATSGIGKEFARKFAKMGYDLILTGRRMEILKGVARELEREYAVEVVLKEVHLEKECERFISFLKEFEDIEVLINNAGYGGGESFMNSQIEESLEMIEVHILSSVKLARACGQLMKEKKKGIIINTSSMAGFNAFRESAMYCSTKAFLTTFSECLGLELRDYGVKVQALCPGFVKTDFHSKLNMEESKLENKGIIRWMESKNVVEYSLKSLEKNNKFICIPGFLNRVLYFMIKLIPRKLYYKITSRGWEYMEKNKTFK